MPAFLGLRLWHCRLFWGLAVPLPPPPLLSSHACGVVWCPLLMSLTLAGSTEATMLCRHSEGGSEWHICGACAWPLWGTRGAAWLVPVGLHLALLALHCIALRLSDAHGGSACLFAPAGATDSWLQWDGSMVQFPCNTVPCPVSFSHVEGREEG